MNTTGLSAVSATDNGAGSANAERMAAAPENGGVSVKNATRGGGYATEAGISEGGDTARAAEDSTDGATTRDARQHTDGTAAQRAAYPLEGVADEAANDPRAGIAGGEQTGGTGTGEGDTSTDGGEVDYEALMRRDLATLKATFPELATLGDIADMRGALRYAALRDLGLTAEEAYMAASAPRVRRDNRAHLSTPVTKGASTAMVGMTAGELHTARELFGGMTDADIYNLYKRVSR